MTDLRISQFTDGGAVQATDEIASVRAGANTKVRVGTAAAYDVGTGGSDLVTNDVLGDAIANVVSFDPGNVYPSGDGSQITDIVVSLPAQNILANLTGLTADGAGASVGEVLDLASTTNGHILYRSGTSTWSGTPSVSYGRSVLNLANATAAQTLFQVNPTYPVSSWTPTLVGATTPGSPTYTIRTGRYIQISPYLVWFSASVTITNLGGAAGNMSITGLPFVANGDAAGPFNRYLVINLSLNSSPFWAITSGTSAIQLVDGPTHTGQNSGLTAGEFSAAGSIVIQGIIQI